MGKSIRIQRIKSINTINEPQHEISNNVVCGTSKGSDQPAHMRSLFRTFVGWSLEYSMTVKLLTEKHLEFLSLLGGDTGLSKVYSCQNTTLLEITCHGSLINVVTIL